MSNRRLVEIDGLRAIAISLVVLFHYTKEFFPQHRLFSFGWSGVDLFFVISGFVLYYQVKRKYYKDGKTYYLDYLRNRALRIIPAYYVSVIATILFFGKDKFFTFIFPLHHASSSTGLVLGNILPGRISEFCYGMIIARMYLEKTELMNKLRKNLNIIIIAILSFICIFICWSVWLKMGDSVLDHRLVNIIYYPLVGLGFGLFFLLVMISPWLNRIMSLKPVTFIGIISYSIYLWHVFALRLIGDVLTDAGGFLITLIATLIISTVSYYFIERTFLKFKA